MVKKSLVWVDGDRFPEGQEVYLLFNSDIVKYLLKTIGCSCVTNNFSLVNINTLKFLLRAAQINQTIQVISLWVTVV